MEKLTAHQKALEEGLALQGHQLLPDGVDLVIFGEETVTAQIHPVAVMLMGTGNAADIFAFFNDNGLNIGIFQHFVCGGEAGRACADDQCGFLVSHSHCPRYTKIFLPI